MRNTAKVARIGCACLAGPAGVVLVILSASLAEATYGPRTTIGANYQQTSNTRSADGIIEGNCFGVDSCWVLFQPAPQQKALIVQHVSCHLVVSAGELQVGTLLNRKGQLLPLRSMDLLPVPTTVARWVVNSPVMHLVKSGERPVVSFLNSTNANWSVLECSISGRLQQP
jgi:hypothetical protein